MDRLLAPLAEAIDSEQAELRAALVGSQLVGLVMARYVIGFKRLASAAVEEMIAAVGDTFQKYLTGPLG